MSIVGETPDSASFNQAFYQQQRINEIILRVDRLSISPLLWNFELDSYNFQIIYNDLCSLFLTISAKLKADEQKDTNELRKKIKTFLEQNPIFITKHGALNSKTKMFNIGKWNVLHELLFDYRLELERLMDVHGFGNPSKEDPRKSIVGN